MFKGYAGHLAENTKEAKCELYFHAVFLAIGFLFPVFSWTFYLPVMINHNSNTSVNRTLYMSDIVLSEIDSCIDI